MSSLELTFLGTGTSQGIPAIGCRCAVCLSEDPKDKRTRTSLLMQTDELHLVIDTTPEFRIQCLREKIHRLDAALFTHAHTDHIMGFDDMRRFCEMGDRAMPIYASASTMEQLQSIFGYAFNDPQPWKNYLRLDPHLIAMNQMFQLGDLTVLPVELPHGKISSTGYVFSKNGRNLLAYFTDCATLPCQAMEAAQAADILILDALRETPHPTHMNFDQAMAAAREIRSKSTYFIHLCHDVSHAKKQMELPDGYHVAYDGLKISLEY
jgi:phosphoribosyl 1,2-cyclic phosphate phosphodiesterase